MNKKFIQKSTLLRRTFVLITILTSFLVFSSANAATTFYPTLTGTRTYRVDSGTITTDGIRGGAGSGALPIEIVGTSCTSGCQVVRLKRVFFTHPFNVGDSTKKYNNISLSYVFNQPKYNSTFDTWSFANAQPYASVTTAQGQNIQTYCRISAQDGNSKVVTCDWALSNYENIVSVGFNWGSDSTDYIAYVGTLSAGVGYQNFSPLKILLAQYDVQSSSDPLLAGQSTIINQNSLMIEQNNAMIEQNQELINQRQQDADAIQNASNQGQNNANNAANDNEGASQNLIQVASGIVSAFASPATNCTLNGDLGNVNLGTLNFCTDKPTAVITAMDAIATCIVAFMVFRIIKRLISRFTALSAYGQGGSE